MKKKVKLIADEKYVKNIYTLLGKDWDYFQKEDYANLRTYFREIIFENIGEQK